MKVPPSIPAVTRYRELYDKHVRDVVKEYDDACFGDQIIYNDNLDYVIGSLKSSSCADDKLVYISEKSHKSMLRHKDKAAEGTFWTVVEKEAFFTALSRFSIHDLDGIKSLLPKKSKSQILQYYNILKNTSEELKKSKNWRSGFFNQFMPIAYEMSEFYIDMEEELSRIVMYQDTNRFAGRKNNLAKSTVDDSSSDELIITDNLIDLTQEVYFKSAMPAFVDPVVDSRVLRGIFSKRKEADPKIDSSVAEDLETIVKDHVTEFVRKLLWANLQNLKSDEDGNIFMEVGVQQTMDTLLKQNLFAESSDELKRTANVEKIRPIIMKNYFDNLNGLWCGIDYKYQNQRTCVPKKFGYEIADSSYWRQYTRKRKIIEDDYHSISKRLKHGVPIGKGITSRETKSEAEFILEKVVEYLKEEGSIDENEMIDFPRNFHKVVNLKEIEAEKESFSESESDNGVDIHLPESQIRQVDISQVQTVAGEEVQEEDPIEEESDEDDIQDALRRIDMETKELDALDMDISEKYQRLLISFIDEFDDKNLEEDSDTEKVRFYTELKKFSRMGLFDQTEKSQISKFLKFCRVDNFESSLLIYKRKFYKILTELKKKERRKYEQSENNFIKQVFVHHIGLLREIEEFPESVKRVLESLVKNNGSGDKVYWRIFDNYKKHYKNVYGSHSPMSFDFQLHEDGHYYDLETIDAEIEALWRKEKEDSEGDEDDVTEEQTVYDVNNEDVHNEDDDSDDSVDSDDYDSDGE